ncbi:RagB/SusD family nutrient uptake outer membrane protein [Sinomicrobium kalidii]|uniref:RagB/SusD family nutrient uptake outer membrane protein n=1 Tax=Sinomicrobium kalidii TaxID=2900738 RepID=UPI001E5B45BD|nr:RagB/SusD family nutrient uptake outer membrane protein [Sinomicrobium kalidii]UGU15473.1 RagB/SusD family nutrient uptake outer membrane protein [Sinomicrobium kalidii]
MKKIKQNIYRKGFIFLMALHAISCSEDYLDITPRGDLIASRTSDYELLFYNNDMINIGSDLTVKMSPEVCAIDQFFSGAELTRQRAFRWEADIYQPVDVPNEVSDFMGKIYVFNKIINEVMQSTGENENEKASLRAEALASRAWCYFNLINFYGRPYNPQTAASDPGFPIVTEADVRQDDFVRSSVQEVYDFIINDLETAIPDLPYSEDRLRMGRGAAEALLAKVHVFMGNYPEALTLFDNAFDSFDASPLDIRIYDLNVTTLPGGVNEPGSFGPSTPPVADNTEIVYHKYLVNLNAILNSDVLLSPETAALYGANDIRFNENFSDSEFFGPPFAVPGVYRRLAPPQVIIGIDIKDIYLLRTECKARTGDLEGAISDLEDYRELRMPETDADVPDMGQTDLIRYVIDERRREYAVQGTEWFTVRRIFNDPVFSSDTYIHTLYNNDGTVRETYSLTEDRLQLRFTDNILQENPGLTNNP